MSATPRQLHFLLVEDDLDHAYLVGRSMTKARVANTLDHVCDGLQALKYLAREQPYSDRRRPDVILLDLKLPKVDGHEVLASVKASPELKAIPVIVLTTSGTETDRLKAYAHHANSYIVKPLDGEEFQAVIEQIGRYWGAIDTGPPGPDVD